MKDEKTYSEKLKDPRWQKKRLEIMQRDKWKCKGCEDETSMLTVHHLQYINGLEPWEYKGEYLITLCELCHKVAHFDLDITTTRESFDLNYFITFIEPIWSRVYFDSIEFYKGDTTVSLRTDHYLWHPTHIYNIIKILGRLKNYVERNCECNLFITQNNDYNQRIPIYELINSIEYKPITFKQLETEINGKEIH